MPTATNGVDSVSIDADPAVVYELVSDITRMGEWSPECYHAKWLTTPPTATVGARFVGYNRLGRRYRWKTVCVVSAARPGREFAFTVVDKHDREETLWRYQLAPSTTGTGTVLTESYQFLWCPLWNRITELPLPRDRHLRRGLHKTLHRIKAAAENTDRSVD